MAFSPDGKLLATGSADGIARLWAPSSGKELQRFQGSSSRVNSVVFSPDGKLLAAGSGDGATRLWEVNGGKEIRRFQAGVGAVHSVAFSADGKLLATGSEDALARLWDVPSGKELHRLKGHSRAISSVALSRDGRLLASGSQDCYVRLWDVQSGKEVGERIAVDVRENELPEITAVAFSPDSRFLAAGTKDGSQLWDIGRHTLVHDFPYAGTVLAFSADGALLAGGSDRSISVFDARSGEALKYWTVHEAEIHAIAFSPDGKRLATASADNTTRLWDLEGAELGSFISSPGGWAAQLGNKLLRSDDGRLLRWVAPDGRHGSLPPPRPEKAPALSLALDSLPPADPSQKTRRLVVRVANEATAGRAYWIRVSALDLPSGMSALPSAVLRLEPGQTAPLALELLGERKKHWYSIFQPAPRITLAVDHAFGEGPRLRVRLP